MKPSTLYALAAAIIASPRLDEKDATFITAIFIVLFIISKAIGK